MEKLTDCEYVFDAFDENKNLINWKELHGKTFRLSVSEERCRDHDATHRIVGLWDEKTNRKYIILDEKIPYARG